jgi:hypothetical protein
MKEETQMTATTWPSTEQYALAHRCSTCGAAPGEPCNAPRKGGRSHVAGQDAGVRHYKRDIGRAPWPEDRVPGKRYDSLTHLSNEEVVLAAREAAGMPANRTGSV